MDGVGGSGRLSRPSLSSAQSLPLLLAVGAGVAGRAVLDRLLAVTRGRGRRQDRGDVPGWVLVTLMTAGLVLVLWGLARDRLTQVFNDSIDGVVNGGR